MTSDAGTKTVAAAASPITPALSTDFPTAYSSLSLSALFRQSPTDFYVDERLGFDLSGEGEHQCIAFEKIGHNTHWVIAALAEYAQVKEQDIGYCGRKDRHAITRQWVSIYCPPVAKHRQDGASTTVDWSDFTMDGVRILSVTHHHKKLRIGDHASNDFTITLRDVRRHVNGVPANLQKDGHVQASALSGAEKVSLTDELKRRLSLGVPNYYGAQRFGRLGNNLSLAHQWLSAGISPPRKQRSMVLSAARSYIFNALLAHRVTLGQWNTVIDGDVLEGGVPTGPLWGRGRSAAKGDALEYEQDALKPLSLWCEKLEYLGLQQERRPLILTPQHLEVDWEEHDLRLSFRLPTGTFATSVLAEVAACINQSQP